MKQNSSRCANVIQNGVGVAKIYDVEKEQYYEIKHSNCDLTKKIKVVFYSKKKIVRKELDREELVNMLLKKSIFRMVSICVCDSKEIVYGVLSEVSAIRGVASPFVLRQDNIIYFPQLRYSDLGLIKYMCENEKMEKYKLLMASGF